MPTPIADNYFSSGVWTRDGPLSLARFTCMCGNRHKTWASFKLHRSVCSVGKSDEEITTSDVYLSDLPSGPATK